jgi:glutathione synthase/RimK-type ligase-like ATP-grasp enzyme
MKIGICSKELFNSEMGVDEHHYELKELYYEFEKNSCHPILIDVGKLSFEFDRKKKQIGIFHDNEDISNINLLIVRRTKGIEAPVAVLAKSLNYNGACVIDGVERFSGAPPSKLISTILRFEKGIGSTSYFALSKQSAIELLGKIKFPIITKPIGGKQGDNVFKISTKEEYLDHVHLFFDPVEKGNSKIFFLQKYMHFKIEYRAFVIGGECIGLAKKIGAKGSLVPNAAKGGKFEKAENNEIIQFVESNCDPKAILGVDVAIDENEEFHIIEANFSPQWKEFEKATGINIAQKIVLYGLRRLSKQVGRIK